MPNEVEVLLCNLPTCVSDVIGPMHLVPHSCIICYSGDFGKTWLALIKFSESELSEGGEFDIIYHIQKRQHGRGRQRQLGNERCGDRTTVQYRAGQMSGP